MAEETKYDRRRFLGTAAYCRWPARHKRFCENNTWQMRTRLSGDKHLVWHTGADRCRLPEYWICNNADPKPYGKHSYGKHSS